MLSALPTTRLRSSTAPSARKAWTEFSDSIQGARFPTLHAAQLRVEIPLERVVEVNRGAFVFCETTPELGSQFSTQGVDNLLLRPPIAWSEAQTAAQSPLRADHQ
jgi:hypothetical protein